MEITAYHDSHQTACRFPFGAVPGGTAVTLHLVVQGRGTEAVFLRLWEQEREILLPMDCTEKEQEAPERAEARQPGEEPEVRSRRYGITFTVPERGCLVWYYFLIRQGEETCWYGNNEAQQGGMGQLWDREPPSFQITVYDRDSVTPAWLKQAVVYQIFPDRFCRGKVPADRFQGKPGALIHSAWEGNPCYVKDKEGQVAYYDFYGGTLEGILEKLPYLEKLGVNCLYLNPIFQARSNHRYDTGDYKAIDPFLGSEETFRILCREARRHGMRILLDGVFSHTGADSRYFNRAGTYKGLGAWQGPASPYYKWYHFRKYPEDYGCWWGDRSLPEVTETEHSYLDFIIRDKDSVLHHWLDAGISGWRLDVADELPDGFLTCFYQELKAKEPDAALIGEVWEDASNKESYGIQRQYLSGGKLDSVMNYVLRNLMLDFALGKTDAQGADRRYWQQVENYPRENLYAMLNLLGSHDVERLRTLLEARYEPKKARALNGLLRAWQMTLPGAPAVYYGDEAGLTGGRDPENRKPFPWGKEDKQLEGCCRSLIQLRRSHTALSTGRFQTFWARGDGYVYGRFLEGGRDVFGQPGENGVFVIALNRGDQPLQAEVDTEGLAYGELEPVWNLGDWLEATQTERKPVPVTGGSFVLDLPPRSAVVYRCREKAPEKAPGRLLERGAGVLLHSTSLPGENGREILASALGFLDFLQAAGQKIWQILPLNPPGLGDSPYLSQSAFGGQEALFAGAFPLPRKEDPEFAVYCRKNRYWLEDYALFRALQGRFPGQPWQTWPEELKNREPEALEKARRELADQMTRAAGGQFVFWKAWQQIRRAARDRGITLLGDMPLFVAPDSADVWAHRELFQLDGDGYPTEVAGVPPDYFSRTGQVWGNPLYNWQAMEKENWRWWQERFQVLATEADWVRIDHFRGFAAVWGVKAGAQDAREGRWIPGPGAALFEAVEQAVPDLGFVAEDLGIITRDVTELREKLGLPGMRILQFHSRTREDGIRDFATEPGCLAYTGTHDNNTLVGWLQEDLEEDDFQKIWAMAMPQEAGVPDRKRAAELVEPLIRYLYSRNARWTIVPAQDLLALPGKYRMNTPGTPTGNWQWKLEKGQLTEKLAERLRKMVKEWAR